MHVNYSIHFYNASVQADIDDWPSSINASFTRITEQTLESGPNLGLPYTKTFGDGLFEIRAKGEEGIGRAGSLVGRKILILHGFIKKMQQTPNKELKIARKRLKEVQHG